MKTILAALALAGMLAGCESLPSDRLAGAAVAHGWRPHDTGDSYGTGQRGNRADGGPEALPARQASLAPLNPRTTRPDTGGGSE